MTALTAPATGDVLPIVDVSETAAADKNKKITVQELFKGVPDGTAAAPALAFESDDGNGIYLAGTDTVGISTGGTQRVTVNGSGDVSISGSLTVSGTTTTIESTTVTVDDKNIELGSVATPTDTTADGGGITLKGATDHTIVWTNSSDSWDFSEHVNIASGKEFRVAGTKVIDATSLGSAVVSSSLTSVGTITTGTWNATQIATAFIADDAITTDKINASAVGTTEIANSAVTTAKINNDAVTADKLADTAVTAGSYTAADITVDAQGRITSAASGTIGTSEIADDAVTAAKLADTAVTAGSYSAADITVDAQGRITAASDGSAPVGGANAISMNDNVKINFGTGNDLGIYHDATDSYIDNNTGHIFIRSNVDDDDGGNIYIQAKSGENSIICADDASVYLYHDNSQCLQTTNQDGVGSVQIFGSLIPDGDNTGAVGTTARTWADGQFTNLTVNSTLNVRGAIDLADNDILRLGSGDDAEFFVNGSHLYLDLNSGIGNFYIRDGTTTRYTFDDNGTLTCDRVVSDSSAHAWAHFKGSGTLSLDRSYRVSSLADLGTGRYRVNLSDSINTNACCVAGGTYQASRIGNASPETTARIRVSFKGTNDQFYDDDNTSVIVFDL